MNRRQFLQAGSTFAALPLLASRGLAAQSGAQSAPVPPLPPPGADGWISLLNFKNLDGFYTMLEKSGKGVAEKKGWVTFEDGMLHVMGNLVTDEPAEAGYIATYQEFENYRLRAEYKWGVKRFPPRLDSKRDNGVLYHLVGEDKVWPNCVECQVQEGDVCDYFLLGDTRAVPARGGQVGGVGSDGQTVNNRKLRDQGGDFENRDGWNVVEVIVKGDSSIQLLNGTALNRLSGFQWKDPAAGGQYVPLTRGKIAIEIEYAETWYRRFEIKPLA
jgi:hypothetical protein